MDISKQRTFPAKDSPKTDLHMVKMKKDDMQTPGDREGQGSLVCCSPWGCKESDTPEQLNNNNKGN